jgi:hypothetical protein
VKRLKKLLRWRLIDRPKTLKFLIETMNEEALKVLERKVDPRELLALTFGFIITIVLILKGDLETGKTIALALIFYGIGRSVP